MEYASIDGANQTYLFKINRNVSYIIPATPRTWITESASESESHVAADDRSERKSSLVSSTIVSRYKAWVLPLSPADKCNNLVMEIYYLTTDGGNSHIFIKESCK